MIPTIDRSGCHQMICHRMICRRPTCHCLTCQMRNGWIARNHSSDFDPSPCFPSEMKNRDDPNDLATTTDS
jgi:hypothetical protein